MRIDRTPVRVSFSGDVVRLATGTALAQLIALAATPWLARIYGPGAFGIAAVFASVVGIFRVIACLSYEQAILLPDAEEDAAHVLFISLIFSSLVATLVVPATAAFPRVLSAIGGTDELRQYGHLIGPAVAMYGMYAALSYWATRRRQYAALSITRVLSQLTYSAAAVLAATIGLANAGSLVGATLLGQGVATTVLGLQIWKQDRPILNISYRRTKLLATLKRYRDFPKFTVSSTLLNASSWQVPLMMLGAFFGSTTVGFYALGFRVIQVPMSLVGQAVGQVFFQRASHARQTGSLAVLVRGLLRKLLVIALLPCLLLLVAGQEIFSVLFGAQWREAGVYTQILAIWAFVWFLSSPLSNLYYVLERQREELYLQAGIFVSRVAAISYGGMVGSARMAIGAFAFTGVLVYGILTIVVLRFAGVRARELLRDVQAEILVAMLYAAPTASVRWLHGDAKTVTIVAAATMLLYTWRRQIKVFFAPEQPFQTNVTDEKAHSS